MENTNVQMVTPHAYVDMEAVNPLDLSAVDNVEDKRVLNRIDFAVCNLDPLMPALTKSVPYVKPTHYVLHYTWDNPGYYLDVNHFLKTVHDDNYVMNSFLAKDGLRVHVFTCKALNEKYATVSYPGLERPRVAKRSRLVSESASATTIELDAVPYAPSSTMADLPPWATASSATHTPMNITHHITH